MHWYKYFGRLPREEHLISRPEDKLASDHDSLWDATQTGAYRFPARETSGHMLQLAEGMSKRSRADACCRQSARLLMSSDEEPGDAASGSVVCPHIEPEISAVARQLKLLSDDWISHGIELQSSGTQRWDCWDEGSTPELSRSIAMRRDLSVTAITCSPATPGKASTCRHPTAFRESSIASACTCDWARELFNAGLVDRNGMQDLL